MGALALVGVFLLLTIALLGAATLGDWDDFVVGVNFVAAPIPEPAAVTIATRPSKRRAGGTTLNRPRPRPCGGVPPSVRHVDVIELEPKVIEANAATRKYRKFDPLSDPRVNVITNDARGALSLTDKRYDAIVSQPSHPWTAGASHLYTREFMQLGCYQVTICDTIADAHYGRRADMGSLFGAVAGAAAGSPA